MSHPSRFSLVLAASAEARLSYVEDIIDRAPAGARVLVVGATRGAADDLVRRVAARRTATFGLMRLGLMQLAARAAAPWLAARRLAPASALGLDAIAARAVDDARRSAPLDYLDPVAETPGFARALAATVRELGGSGIAPKAVARAPASGPDIARLLRAHDDALARAGAVDRASLFAAAASQLAAHPIADIVIVLDVPAVDPAAVRLLAACAGGAREAVITVPRHDLRSRSALEQAGGRVVDLPEPDGNALARLRLHLFDRQATPAEARLDESLHVWSAPGEGREAVEIARRLVDEGRRGVRFDEMAVLLRAPQAYASLLEQACRRAAVPLWFERGTERPDPAGRAWLALMACAAEGLSASRFAEYLSLGQVPPDAPASPPDAPAYVEAEDDPFGRGDQPGAGEAGRGADTVEAGAGGDAVRAPWRWERLLVDAAVIGGDPARWHRRLEGLAASLALQAAEAARRDGDEESPRAAGLRSARTELDRLGAFALPVISALASWPRSAPWGAWLDAFNALAPLVLRAPERVQRVFADLRPMAAIGPVTLDEVRRVLRERLLTLSVAPPDRRYGRVFVGTPEQARGRRFRVVFLPALAERLFPQRPREDPLLLDAGRLAVSADLARQDERLAVERGQLSLAVGAATERLSISYPRIEVGEGRARVPSLYALEIVRAATGRIPPHEELERWARAAGQASLGWPAPPDPAQAIDDQEHDLAMLRRLLDRAPEDVRGHAHYLLKLNEALRRSVVDRWARGARRWSPNDGLVRVTPATAPVLATQRLTARAFSLSVLQRYAACPYQFLLAGVFRLQPRVDPAPLQLMDPLTRGSLFHEVQARFLRALQGDQALPVTTATHDAALTVLDATVSEVAAEYRDSLAPAVDRVWEDGVAGIRRDLHGWLDQLVHDGAEWRPAYFELGFGAVPGERDPHSVPDSVPIGPGFLLRGAVDLVEISRTGTALRVTDHKTGRVPDGLADVRVGKGMVLQPVLYGVAVEQVLGLPVQESRLSYCTSVGGFTTHAVSLTDVARAEGLEVLTVIDRAIEAGVLPAAPTAEACPRCDFRAVCGSDVARRVASKPAALLADLHAVRALP